MKTTPTTNFEEAEMNKAMEEMECWQFQEHVKKCRDCQRIIAKTLFDKL